MKQAVNIFLLVFYVFGTICLPAGDFSVLKDIPEMYRHCKAHEDKDMTPLDFITDHLVNIDGIFDEHNNGDEQKPHEPQQRQHHGQQTVFFTSNFTFTIKQINFIQINPGFIPDHFHASEFITTIFRPPIV